MKSQKIKFDKKKDYIFVKDVESPIVGVLKRRFNLKSFKIKNNSSVSFSCWTNVDKTVSLYISLYEELGFETLFTNRKGMPMDIPIVKPEGESLFLQFNSLDDAQEFIKVNYEITGD